MCIGIYSHIMPIGVKSESTVAVIKMELVLPVFLPIIRGEEKI
jgi:hypothetical protein